MMKWFKQRSARKASSLPLGKAEFEEWADSFFDIYDLPTQDKESIQFILATAIINLGPNIASVPKSHFYEIILAASAKQVASQVFFDIKTKQKQAMLDAEKRAKEKEATSIDAETPIEGSEAPLV